MACPITVTKFVGTISLGLLTVRTIDSILKFVTNYCVGSIILRVCRHRTFPQPPLYFRQRLQVSQRGEAPKP